VWVHASLAKQKWVMKCRLTSQWWVSAASSTAISSTTWSDSNRGKKKTDCALDNFLWFHALHEIISETNKDSFQKVRNQDAMNVHLSTRKHQPIEILSSAKVSAENGSILSRPAVLLQSWKKASYRTSASTQSSDEQKNVFAFNCIDVFQEKEPTLGGQHPSPGARGGGSKWQQCVQSTMAQPPSLYQRKVWILQSRNKFSLKCNISSLPSNGVMSSW